MIGALENGHRSMVVCMVRRRAIWRIRRQWLLKLMSSQNLDRTSSSNECDLACLSIPRTLSCVRWYGVACLEVNPEPVKSG